MKKIFIWIGSVLLVILLTSQVIPTQWKGNKESSEAMIDEQEWKISPAFKIGERTMLGDSSKIGILDTTFHAGKQKGMHWYLWGNQKKLVKGTFKLTARTQETKPIIIAENHAIAYGSDGVDAQVPTLVTIPFPGLWKFDAFVNDKMYGSIIISVSD